jgi:type IV secretory pathway VirB6-like protein
MNSILNVILIGAGATFSVDIWVFILNIFKIKSLDYRYVGRWVANFSQGKFIHDNIMKTQSVKGELVLGWTVHYVIGIAFAFLLIIVYGETWLVQPTLYAAILIGIATSVAPLFIMQPAFGFGIASSKLSNPNMRRFKSLLTHLVYGVGLYSSAWLIQAL